MNKKIKRGSYDFAIFLLPTVLAFAIAFVIPFLSGLYLSFTSFTTVSDATFVGLENFKNIFKSGGDFLASLKFTAAFAAVSVLSVNLFAFLLALLLSKGLRGRTFFRTVFFMPNLIGGIVLGYIWQLVLNGILMNFGVTLTTSEVFGFWGLVVLTNWQMIGYMMVIYIAGITSVPSQMLEAARVDGAGEITTLFKIIVPHLKESFTICLFLTLTNSFKLFDQNLSLTGGAPSGKSAMLALNIYDTFYGSVGREGQGQAKAGIFSGLVGVLAFLQFKLTEERGEKRNGKKRKI